MEKDNNYYDCLQCEFFEVLIPRMLYKGTVEQQEDFFRFLIEKKKAMVQDLYKVFCKSNDLTCPYGDSDFETELFERGGIRFLQIQVPEHPGSGMILRAYLLFMKGEDGSCIKKYFLIRRLDNGSIFILHITPELKGILGKELTDCGEDMEAEYLELARDFVAYWIQDQRTEKRKKKKKRPGKDK